MIFNAYAVLVGLLALVRLPLGIAVAAGALRMFGRIPAVSLERRGWYLLGMLAGLLLVLNVLAWPLFYLLLDSYIPQWPGVMCIYGVTRIGSGSRGATGLLPALLASIQTLKPALIMMGGAWGLFYLANRRTAADALWRPQLGLLGLLGGLSALDALLEGSYLIIPKAEPLLAVGCCSETFNELLRTNRFLPGADGALGRDLLVRITGWSTSLLALALWVQPWRVRVRASFLLLLLAALLVPLHSMFLVHAAAPRLLNLPYHHCPYDLLARVPESVVGVGLGYGALCSVGWAFLLLTWARSRETESFLNRWVRDLWRLAALGYAGATMLFAVAMVLT